MNEIIIHQIYEIRTVNLISATQKKKLGRFEAQGDRLDRLLWPEWVSTVLVYLLFRMCARLCNRCEGSVQRMRERRA